STLEETVAAQLLLILVDVNDPNSEMQLETVMSTLDEIGATDQPRVIVVNKVDLLENQADLLVWLNRHPDAISISAATGAGVDELEEVVIGHYLGGVREVVITAPLSDSDTISFLEKRTEVIERDYPDGKAALTVRLGRRHVDLLLARGAQITINGRPPLEAVEVIWPSDPAPA
ncbi:MAG: GTPase HflX, partial [bacterium]|nr:GTPase HflX [bacterium]